MKNKIIKIYKGTPTFPHGEIAMILDHDSNDDSYAVAPLAMAEKEENDAMRLLQNHCKWVKPENFEEIDFEKPKENKTDKGLKILALFFGTYILTVGLLICLN